MGRRVSDAAGGGEGEAGETPEFGGEEAGDRLGLLLQMRPRPARRGVDDEGSAAPAAPGLGVVPGDPGDGPGGVGLAPMGLRHGGLPLVGQHQRPARGVAHPVEGGPLRPRRLAQCPGLGGGGRDQHRVEGPGEALAPGPGQGPSPVLAGEAGDRQARGHGEAGQQGAHRIGGAGGARRPARLAPGGGGFGPGPGRHVPREAGIACGEVLRAVIEGRAIGQAAGRHAPPEATALVEHRDPVPGGVEGPGGARPRHAGPDDGDGRGHDRWGRGSGSMPPL
jgi:hypothetical protein